jgi:hypothetical protein
MVMRPAGFGAKNDCAGEDQQKFTNRELCGILGTKNDYAGEEQQKFT